MINIVYIRGKNELDREIVLEMNMTNSDIPYLRVKSSYLSNGVYQNELVEGDIVTYKSEIDLSFHDALALGASLLMR